MISLRMRARSLATSPITSPPPLHSSQALRRVCNPLSPSPAKRLVTLATHTRRLFLLYITCILRNGSQTRYPMTHRGGGHRHSLRLLPPRAPSLAIQHYYHLSRPAHYTLLPACLPLNHSLLRHPQRHLRATTMLLTHHTPTLYSLPFRPFPPVLRSLPDYMATTARPHGGYHRILHPLRTTGMARWRRVHVEVPLRHFYFTYPLITPFYSQPLYSFLLSQPITTPFYILNQLLSFLSQPITTPLYFVSQSLSPLLHSNTLNPLVALTDITTRPLRLTFSMPSSRLYKGPNCKNLHINPTPSAMPATLLPYPPCRFERKISCKTLRISELADILAPLKIYE